MRPSVGVCCGAIGVGGVYLVRGGCVRDGTRAGVKGDETEG
jgi:hypothetical protein